VAKSECVGWIGKIFGHKFKQFLVESKGPSPEQIKESLSRDAFSVPSYTEEILRNLRSEKYSVRCKRCGIDG
jgi:hypothetical protein